MLKKINGNLAVLTSIVTLSFLFLFVSFIPNVYEAFQTDKLPQNRVMIWGEHIYTYDYNTYLSKIRQGVEGRWTIVDKYNNNPDQKGVFLHMLYLLSGQLARLFKLAPVLTYQLLRVFLSFFWVLTIVFLNVYFLKKPSLFFVGVLFSLFASSFPVFTTLKGHFWLGMYMDWWQEMDVLKRISYLPHYLLNYIFISALIFLLHLFDKTANLKYFAVLIALLFISPFVHPSATLVFLIAWVLYHTSKFLLGKKLFLKKFFLQSVVLFLVASLPFLYFRQITLTYPWKTLTDFDKNYRLGVDLVEYIFALGPVFFTGFSGLVLVLKNKKSQLLPLSSWVLAVLVGIFLFKFFPYQSELRFIQSATHIPLSVLSVYFLSQLNKKLKTTIFSAFIVGFIVVLGLSQIFYSLWGQLDFIKQRVEAVAPQVPYPPQVMYPLKEFYLALSWLGTLTPKNTVVLSKVTAGNHIPAYSGNLVYLGHVAETPLFDKKEVKANQFFSGIMEADQASQFLADENISYVFYGPQEKEKASESIEKYQFLQKVFEVGTVSIYQVKDRM